VRKFPTEINTPERGISFRGRGSGGKALDPALVRELSLKYHLLLLLTF
jgi:hypothetical protein